MVNISICSIFDVSLFINRSRTDCSGNAKCNLFLGLKHYDQDLGYYGFDNSYTPGIVAITSNNDPSIHPFQLIQNIVDKLSNGQAHVNLNADSDLQEKLCLMHYASSNVHNIKSTRANKRTRDIDECIFDGSNDLGVGRDFICQKPLVRGFGEHKLLTSLNIKSHVTTLYRNTTTEQRIKTDLTAVLVGIKV